MRLVTPPPRPPTTQYPISVGVSDDWAHQTSMNRAIGSDAATMLSAQSAMAQAESQAEPGLAQASTKLNEADAAFWRGLSSLV